MAIISKDRKEKRPFFGSIRVKFTISYLLLIIITIVVMNTFFLTQSRNMIFESKKSSIQNQAAVLATSLSVPDELTKDIVSQTMDLLDVRGLSSIIVADDTGDILYDTTQNDDEESTAFFESHLESAREGYDVFYSGFDGTAFSTSALVPIMKNSIISGVIFVHEYDTAQGAFLTGLQNTIKNISILISALSILILFYLVRTILTRITKIVTAVETVREGEYNYRIDISGNDEITQLGDEFNSLTMRLQKTDEVRRRFVADASHELKTPLASIRLLSDSILQNEDMDVDTLREFVSDIGSESERLTRTTEKLLSLTRLDSHLMRERGKVDMRDAVASTLRMLQPLAAGSNITLQSNLDGGCVILANGDDIHQVVFNLIENAIKYNFPGGLVNVSLSRTESTAEFSVDDTGVGIPESDLPFIFDRFYRVDKARSREAGGSGLGLSIVKATVLEHGGEIDAQRKKEGGMIFKVSFPLYDDNSDI